MATRNKVEVDAYYTDEERLVLVTAENVGGGYAVEDALTGTLFIIDADEFETSSWRLVQKAV